MNTINSKILEKIGDEKIVDKLLSLSKSDLNSVLLEVFEKQTDRFTAADVLKVFQLNRFSTPSDINPANFHDLEAQLLLAAQKMDIQTVLLSPSAPLGSCSVFGCVDQYNIVSAVRGTETLADPSNMLAIIIADKLKKRKESNTYPLHYAATARVTRAQQYSGMGFFAHFGIFCMVSSGKDTGSYRCETELLDKHLLFYKDFFQEQFSTKLSIVLRKRNGYKDSDGFFAKMSEVIQNAFPDVSLSYDSSDMDNKYYQGINFKIFVEIDGEKIEIGDGGFVDWIYQMLGSKKQKCLISGVGLDRLLFCKA
ncbi:hypothetical protein I2494_01680 [Budviciaceae bacterium BWR-B9]|uniref:Uncharacterized protein n=1 Tax=Limnobaculum allomyrinae TaxID=2791986 RepID=A0ABS1IL14_9GAMM|nr:MULTISPECIES: hypothetical protein [Limnobaculum]MBK5142445.1 hypothetical protein [Limnobaculum allomyrinae]MBV7690670.1 hypothetical protein [Limnobaculum sp. M2-1]